MTVKFQLFATALAGLLVCSAAGAQMRNPHPHLLPSDDPPVTRGLAHECQQTPHLLRRRASSQTSKRASFKFRPAEGSPPHFPSMQIRSTSTAVLVCPVWDSTSRIWRPSAGPLAIALSTRGMAIVSSKVLSRPFSSADIRTISDDTGYDQPDQQPAESVVQQSAPQPQIIVIQQPVSSQPQVTSSGSEAENLPASGPQLEAAAPIRDVGDFILVRRDGRILFASIFSVVGTQLQYVTPEGIRHTVACLRPRCGRHRADESSPRDYHADSQLDRPNR